MAMLFSGSSHPVLAERLSRYIGERLGKVALGTFPDGESRVELLESVRGEDVFVLQSIAGRPNEYLVELLIMLDAFKRASAKSVTALIPCYGYARQDRRAGGRVPITAKLVADLLQRAGATRVVTIDLHAPQVEGFFDVPLDNLCAILVLAAEIEKMGLSDLMVVCPDVGSTKVAHTFASLLGVDFAVVDKERGSGGQVKALSVIGQVAGKNVLLVDDMVSTGGTFAAAAKACKEAGCGQVVAACTHGLLVDGAIARLEASSVERLLITDTVPQATEIADRTDWIEAISIAGLVGQTVKGEQEWN